jgi:hypothetical protein
MLAFLLQIARVYGPLPHLIWRSIVTTISAAFSGTLLTAIVLALVMIFTGTTGAWNPITTLFACVALGFMLGFVGLLPAAIVLLSLGIPLHLTLRQLCRTSPRNYLFAGGGLGILLAMLFPLVAALLGPGAAPHSLPILIMYALPPFFGSCVGAYVFGTMDQPPKHDPLMLAGRDVDVEHPKNLGPGFRRDERVEF